MERMTIKEYMEIQNKKKKRTKYNNRFVKLDGYTFDSKLEADYYAELVLREKANDIKSFIVQPRYLLQKAFKKDGVLYRKIEYVADFEITHNDGSIEVVDTKGVKTNVFKLKEKMFHNLYPYKLTIVTKNDI